MLGVFPLELWIQILGSLNVGDRIKFRAVCKNGKFVIDQYLLTELNLFNEQFDFPDMFLKLSLTHPDRMNTIWHHNLPVYKSLVKLEKIQFLFRNARKLNIFTSNINFDPMDEFINSFQRLENLYLFDPVVSSIRLRSLKTLEIDVSSLCSGEEYFTEVEAIDCPNLVELIYRPGHYEELSDSQIWSFPNLKKLKVCGSQKFIKRLKHLEVLLMAYFERKDVDLLKELPQLSFLDMHCIDADVLDRIEEEHGQRVSINYRGMPAQLAKNRVRIPHPDIMRQFLEEWTFVEDDLAIYRGQYDQANDQIHFYYYFQIYDHTNQIERSFFRKFVDVESLLMNGDALSEDEVLDILGSFRNVTYISFGKRNFESDFYEKRLRTVCPHLVSYDIVADRS